MLHAQLEACETEVLVNLDGLVEPATEHGYAARDHGTQEHCTIAFK